ncbi:NfeD family protein [Poriferisphaera corsica]|nr:hypothetical protein [Poriferisphaera corsica]
MENLIYTIGQVASQQAPAQGGSSTLLIWGIVLIFVALVLFVIELFIPTAGLIVVMSVGCLIAGIAMLFGFSTTAGVIATLLAMFALPFLIGFGIKIWPHTFFARWLTLDAENPSEDDTHEVVEETVERVEVGMKGKAMTPMRPVGTCVFEKQREECIAESGMIEKGDEVEVTVVDGMQVKVKKV